MSDLHLEFGALPRSYAPPECDVVILAGDIAVGVVGVMWAAETFKVPVLYVPGNHEFYGKRRHFRHLEKLRAKAEGTNVTILNNDAVTIDGVRFLGATMWTDFDLYGTPHVSEQLAQSSMNDYRAIRYDHARLLCAADTRSFHLQSRYFLSESFRAGPQAKTVVVTHHAPSEMSCAPQYRGDPLTPAYASRLEYLMCEHEPALWVHGHMHNTSDYRICETRIVCNPRGYAGHELNRTFNPELVLEV
jgi:Icc-related predicted phosphoesterase